MKNKFGLVMAEALVAIATLIISTFVLSMIVSNSVSTTSSSRDYLLAQNLITEAAEAVKNVRDSNWLIYPSRKECWLMLDPGTALLSECNTAPSATALGNFLATPGDGWLLEAAPAVPLDLETNETSESDPYALHIQTVGVQNEYLHLTTLNNPSGFYRSIVFTSLTDVAPVDGIDDTAVFEVTVQWRNGAKVRNIMMEFTIYNYL